ncbi:MAG: hypothetical protein QOJ57_2990, partial [Thermoleophilaceae bacterium]|nr:hypothetical protein [Thermoleophilaceae bacterium]
MSTSTFSVAGDTMAASGYHGIVLDRLARQAVQILNVEESCIFVRDRAEPDTAIVAAAHGQDEAIVGKRVPVGLERSRARQGALAPLNWGGDIQGTLAVGAAVPERFSEDDTELLNAFAPVVAAAIWHAHTRAETHPDVRSYISALAATLDERDGYTARHSHEVVSTACALGRVMGLESADLAELEV